MDAANYTDNKMVARNINVKSLDFRTIIALAMIRKASAAINVDYEIPESIAEKDFMLVVYDTERECGTLYKDLNGIWMDFYNALETDCEDVRHIFEEDFVKKVDVQIDAAQNNCNTDSMSTYMNCMLAMAAENTSWKTFSKLIDIGESLIEEEERKAVAKHEDLQYLATVNIVDKVMLLDKAVSFSSIISFIDTEGVDVEFVVLPHGDNFKYSAIPVVANISAVRKPIPAQLYRIPLVQIRTITGAETLVSVDMQGRGGICKKYEDAVKLAKLAVSLTNIR